MTVDKPLSDIDRAKIERGFDLLKQMFASLGAQHTLECRQGFGLHLMGGCSLGTDPLQSVVGADFRLHGFPRLWAADSSVFPAAPGINPSFTIMALSAMAAREMLAR